MCESVFVYQCMCAYLCMHVCTSVCEKWDRKTVLRQFLPCREDCLARELKRKKAFKMLPTWWDRTGSTNVTEKCVPVSSIRESKIDSFDITYASFNLAQGHQLSVLVTIIMPVAEVKSRVQDFVFTKPRTTQMQRHSREKQNIYYTLILSRNAFGTIYPPLHDSWIWHKVGLTFRTRIYSHVLFPRFAVIFSKLLNCISLIISIQGFHSRIWQPKREIQTCYCFAIRVA